MREITLEIRAELDVAHITAATRAYFAQGHVYGSFGSERVLDIKRMPPQHARNAAAKMLREADSWALAAGAEDEPDAKMWLISTPLHRALMDRARKA